MTESVAPRPLRGGRIAWQLTQTLWVGGIWSVHFVLLPALQQLGLAPLLVNEIASYMRPLILGFAGVCALLQLLVVWAVLGRGLWRDLRAQLLVLVGVSVAVFFFMPPVAQADYLQLFAYLVVAFAGLVLILQPRPDEAA
ncbi:MAG: DUF4149 domain-containing protein [Pseudomonas sp.]